MSEILENLKKRVAARKPKTPVQVMKTHRPKMLEVSVAELKAAIETRPGHPAAEAFAIGIGLGTDEELPAQSKLTVQAVDLEALLEGAEVETVEVVEDGIPFIDRKMKGKLAPPPKPKKPKDPEED